MPNLNVKRIGWVVEVLNPKNGKILDKAFCWYKFQIPDLTEMVCDKEGENYSYKQLIGDGLARVVPVYVEVEK